MYTSTECEKIRKKRKVYLIAYSTVYTCACARVFYPFTFLKFFGVWQFTLWMSVAYIRRFFFSDGSMSERKQRDINWRGATEVKNNIGLPFPSLRWKRRRRRRRENREIILVDFRESIIVQLVGVITNTQEMESKGESEAKKEMRAEEGTANHRRVEDK